MTEAKILTVTVIVLILGLIGFGIVTLTVLLPMEKQDMINDAMMVANNWANEYPVEEDYCTDVVRQIGLLLQDYSIDEKAKEIMLDGMNKFQKKCGTGGIFGP